MKSWFLAATLLSSAATAIAGPHKDHGTHAVVQYKTYDGKEETMRFSARDAGARLRSYAQSSTMRLRDPGPQYVSYQESDGIPTVRSANLAFDALFALAGAEMKQASVTEIRDGSYNNGAAIACDCFETGEKWHYVWTRDLSYAAHLGLAMLDPLRVRNSLEFKLSGFRTGLAKAAQVGGSEDGLQIVQDTGSGGSWPVSTDRITWAFGAEAALDALGPAERTPFAARAFKALSNTVENDRLAAFDASSGLYTGEQSFLDWREQSYAAWIVNDLSSMATSKALSTNVGHYKALTLAARLAREHGAAPLAAKYQAWALELKKAINARLWLEDAGLYSSLTAPHFDGAPLHKFDWLGQALAIITGVADPARARQILAHYPHGPMGAPVIHPQQQGVPVYHNRAIWPFVTAYGLKAAAMSGNVSVADAAYDTLMRAASLNLSNMENLEWLSGQPMLPYANDQSLAGPVINSKRQLWSVGAYLGMVIGNVFGIGTSGDGIAIRPFITARLRREIFGNTNAIVLNDLRLQGRRITVKVLLPKASDGNGYYRVDSVSVNGTRSASAIKWAALPAESTIEIALGALHKGQQEIRLVGADPYLESSAVFGPREPEIAAMSRDAKGQVTLEIGSGKNGADTVYNIYRDGKLAAAKVAPGAWIDRTGGAAACYAVEAQFTDSGNRSHHSAARCADGGIDIPVTDKRTTSNVTVHAPDARSAAPYLRNWGAPSDSFTVSGIPVAKAGRYQLQVRYHNGANQINLGISGGVKWLTLKDGAGRVAAQGVVQLPHALMKNTGASAYSTPLPAHLAAGIYTLSLHDFYNMSYLNSNSTFSAAGGVEGPSNRFDIHGVRIVQAK